MHRVIFSPFLGLRLRKSLPASVLSASLLLAGCGKAPEPPPAASSEATPTPAQGKPSAVVQPPLTQPPAAPSPTAQRTVYVLEGFQAVNSDGTHEVPTGAAVQVVAEEGDEYVIEYRGISVRTPKAYFSETLVEQVTESPAVSPTPDMIPLTADAPAVDPAATPAALPAEPSDESLATATPPPMQEAVPTPEPTLSAEDAKAQQLMGELRTISDEIRSASEKLPTLPPDEKSRESARINKLKKERDQIGQSLTEVAKP